jgi:hypothetical protein
MKDDSVYYFRFQRAKTTISDFSNHRWEEHKTFIIGGEVFKKKFCVF